MKGRKCTHFGNPNLPPPECECMKCRIIDKCREKAGL